MNIFEIGAIKKDCLFNKEDILRYFKERLSQAIDEKEKIVYKNIIQHAEKKEFMEFPEDFDEDSIHCYIFLIDDVNLVECDIYDLNFQYDNSEHELYLQSISSKNEKLVL